jgi:multidrug efflux pump subunit AcrA (membrane-fusion protein)
MKRVWIAAFFAAAFVGLTTAQDLPKGAEKADKAEKAEKPKPVSAKVERGPLRSDVSFKGMIEASDMVDVQLKPEVWTSFPVLKAVEPGTTVKAGDVLVEFDPEKIDRAIRDLEAEQRLADLLVRAAEIDLPLAERATPLDLAGAERAYKHAKEDFEKWLNVDKKIAIESSEMSLKSALSMLDNQKEELKQLEKMYRSKDLTEETEEIILKRQRFAVEQAEHFVKLAKNRRDQTLNVELVRREKEMRDGLERAEIAYNKAMQAIPLGLEQKKVALEKAKYERGRAKEKFENLRKDRQLFTVRAPTDGVVYWGKCTQGAWSVTPAKLLKGGSVMGDEVFMTIVKPGTLFVRGSVEEKDCRAIAAGQKCKLTMPAFPDAKLSGTVERVATVPVGGAYEVRVALAPTDVPVIPGMSAMVKTFTYEKKDALTLPAGAVQFDDDEDRPHVWKLGKDGGKAEKVFVTVGKRAGSKVEILSGLNEGDEVGPKPTDK